MCLGLPEELFFGGILVLVEVTLFVLLLAPLQDTNVNNFGRNKTLGKTQGHLSKYKCQEVWLEQSLRQNPKPSLWSAYLKNFGWRKASGKTPTHMYTALHTSHTDSTQYSQTHLDTNLDAFIHTCSRSDLGTHVQTH